MRGSNPQRCVQLLNLLKVTRNPTNRDKHINEASKQTYATGPFKRSCKYTQGVFSNWKICFNVFHVRTFDKPLRDLGETIKTLM